MAVVPYDQKFYERMYEITQYSAETILSVVRDGLPQFESLADVGCGVGGWLAVAKRMGVERIAGIDGPWVRPEQLVIPPECFRAYDLTQEYRPEERFDLAITLEVGEHLDEAKAAVFVATLTNLADAVLFSAAIPYQGGVHHVNEQWPEFWSELFRQRGYLACDYVRPKIWRNDKIHGSYRQNAIIYVKESEAGKYPQFLASQVESPLPLVHPSIFSRKMETQLGVRGSFRLFRQAFTRWCREWLTGRKLRR